MMHSVPKTLHGATLGKAQWVRSITDTREYALENPDGERISLADLTNGSTKQVRVVGEVKKNPAHPAAFTGRSFGMNQHVNLTHILPEEVKPALVSSMVREQGLFGAVQSLSILLARPLKDFTPTSPMAEEILRSMFYDYKGGAVPLRNPAPVGFGRSYGGRILGEEIAARDAALMKYVEEAVKKTDSIDLTEGELDNFLKNSFVPYMLAAEANRRAISYIRRFILPAPQRSSTFVEQHSSASSTTWSSTWRPTQHTSTTGRSSRLSLTQRSCSLNSTSGSPGSSRRPQEEEGRRSDQVRNRCH